MTPTTAFTLDPAKRFCSNHLVSSTSSRKIRVLDQNLKPLQEIETESDGTTTRTITFTHYGIHFEGVTTDRESAIFSKDTGAGHEYRKCLLHTGIPSHKPRNAHPQNGQP